MPDYINKIKKGSEGTSVDIQDARIPDVTANSDNNKVVFIDDNQFTFKNILHDTILTGAPETPDLATSTDNSQIANTRFVHDTIESYIDSGLSTTSTNPVQNKVITTALNTKASLANPAFTGTPTAPDIGGATSSRIATKNYVDTAIDNKDVGVTGVKGSSESSYRTGQVNITKANLGLANVENYSRAQILASAALTGTPTAPTPQSNSGATQIATKEYVDNFVPDLSSYMQKGVSYVTAGQLLNSDLGSKATAEGLDTTASGGWSHAEGSNTTASGTGAHAEGHNSGASGNYSHAEGQNGTANGDYSHAEGSYSTASGGASHAEGYGAVASNYYAHAEGNQTTASGQASHAEGTSTIAQRKSQHVFGEWNVADTTGADGTARGSYVEIVGKGTANNARSNARTLDWYGNETLAGKLTVGTAPTANMDVTTKQYVDNKVSSITIPTASDSTPIVDGTGSPGSEMAYSRADHVHPKDSTKADVGHTHNLSNDVSGGILSISYGGTGQTSVANIRAGKDGDGNTISSTYMKKGTDYVTAGQATGQNLGTKATAEGNQTIASGAYSHAEGSGSRATGQGSHGENYGLATGEYSHAEGYNTVASGTYAHSAGAYTGAQRKSQYVFGEYNVLDTGGSGVTEHGNYIEIVGNGTSNTLRSNARTLDWNGNEVLAGKLTVGAAPSNDMDVATKKYVDDNSGGGGVTYTFTGGTNKFIATPSSGNSQTVTITPSIANNVTGSGTNNYLTKFNGTNTITNGPQLGTADGTFLNKAGNWATPSNTTYTFSGGINKFTVVPSDTGVGLDYTITPSIPNNVTGSGTSGYIAKFNGANTITNGPAFGNATTTFLRNDGNWAAPDVKQDGITGAIANRYATCSTAASTAAKTASITAGTFTLETGSTVFVKFTNTNTVSNPTLNINNTGAKSIMRYGTTNVSTTWEGSWRPGAIVCFVYDGTNWVMMTTTENNPAYASVAAESGGTILSLVTTGEKYTWNNKADKGVVIVEPGTASTNYTTISSAIAAGKMVFLKVSDSGVDYSDYLYLPFVGHAPVPMGGGAYQYYYSFSGQYNNKRISKSVSKIGNSFSWSATSVADTPTMSTTTILLTSAGWSGKSQTVTATGVKASNLVQVSPIPSDASGYAAAEIICTAQAMNSLTFTCKTVPTDTISVNVVIWG